MAETSAEEEACLAEWIGASEANLREFSETKALWNAGRAVAEEDGMEHFAAFKRRVDERIDKETGKIRKRKILRAAIATLSVAAAVAAVFLTCTFLGKGVGINPDNIPLVYENTTLETIPIELADGSKVMLRAGSLLTVEKDFNRESTRNVRLEGDAYFDVVHDETKPFNVRTDGLTIKVLGTSFCVTRNDAHGEIEVVLERGSVRLQSGDGHNLATLQPNQKADFNPEEQDLRISQVNAASIVMREYNLVNMENATLFEIISHIENNYKVRLEGELSNLNNKYTFSYMRTNTLDEVLEIVKYLTGNTYRIVYKAED